MKSNYHQVENSIQVIQNMKFVIISELKVKIYIPDYFEKKNESNKNLMFY